MTGTTRSSRNAINGKLIFIAGLFVSAYWLLGNNTNIYSNKFVGIIYEILWLPMIALAVVLPIVSLFFFFKNGSGTRSWYLYVILLTIVTWLLIRFPLWTT